jgi:uncharacterized membrane protein
MAIQETKRRSLYRVISWRITATITTMLISWLITDNTAIAFQIGFLEVTAKIMLQYGHERLWNRLKWGYHSPSEDYHI